MSGREAAGNGTWVRVDPAVRSRSDVGGASCHRAWRVRCGLVGRLVRPSCPIDPEWSLASTGGALSMAAMQTLSASAPTHRLGSIVGRTLFGATLVATGLGFALIVIETPLVPRLVPAAGSGSTGLAVAVFVWVLALVAGAGLSLAGANRLAATVATVRTGSSARASISRMLSGLGSEVVVLAGVVPGDGRPVPELVVGPFGVVVVHELGPLEIVRPTGYSWERRTPRGWVPIESPVDRVTRDADRVRHWLTSGDLEFVVRVYAVLVTADRSIPRSPQCAVIGAEQIPAWFESLPGQRSLTSGRRDRLLDRIREATATARR